jgi:hypothetical protein
MAHSGHGEMSELSPLSGVKRTSQIETVMSADAAAKYLVRRIGVKINLFFLNLRPIMF